MATLRSRPWCVYNTSFGHEARSWSCPYKPRSPSYSLATKNQRIGVAMLSAQKMGKRSKKRYMVAQGYGASEGRRLHEAASVVSEEDEMRFVNAIREVQPYISLNRGRTFVVVIAGEIVTSPYFDAILQYEWSTGSPAGALKSVR